jgi:DNA-binding protein H-NS
MATYLELVAELATLDFKSEVALAAEKAQAIREIQARMVQWNVDPRDLEGRRERKHVKQRRTAA